MQHHQSRSARSAPFASLAHRCVKKSVLKTMNQSNNSTDRQSIILDRRLTRLEETQLTSKEVKLLFDNMAEKIDILVEQLDRQLDLAIAKSPDRVSRFND
jgi:hypothetical protein